MRRAHLALISDSAGTSRILLARKNIYLVPTDAYQFATVGRNGIQYVIPNCTGQPGDDAALCLIGEVKKSLGVTIAPDALNLLTDNTDFVAWSVALPAAADIDSINRELSLGSFASRQYQSAALFALEDAFAVLGNQESVHGEPWVTQQVARAVAAGFGEALINRRINASHSMFTWIIADLIVAPAVDNKAVANPAAIARSAGSGR